LWFHCRKCGKFLPKAALAGLGAGVSLVLYSILAINIFLLHTGTGEWLNHVCVPTLIVTIPFFFLYVVLTRGNLSLCEGCNLRENLQASKAIMAKDNVRRMAILSRERRMGAILKADPDLGVILAEMKSIRRAGWQSDESTLILLRLARNLERRSRYCEAADILQRLGLDRRANLMRRRASEEHAERSSESKVG
jgi:hypothetical protein